MTIPFDVLAPIRVSLDFAWEHVADRNRPEIDMERIQAARAALKHIEARLIAAERLRMAFVLHRSHDESVERDACRRCSALDAYDAAKHSEVVGG